jgi:phenylacetate-CoA ligase
MKKQFMKNVRDNMPESLKYLTAPIFRNKLIYNKEFCRCYQLLGDRETLDQNLVREYQFNQLKEILIYSYVTVPYYSELFDKVSFNPYEFSDFKQIEKIPFLTRKLVTENFDKLISTRKVDNGYYVGSTGGSTGVALKFLLDYDSIYKENAFIYYYRRKLGYNFSDKVATFRTHGPSTVLWSLNPMYREVIFSNSGLSKVTVRKYADKINRLKPDYLNGYISSIWFFAKLLEEYNIRIDLRLKGIFLISENPDPEQRQFIEKFFKVESSTFYGHSERVVIAEERQPDRYVFDPYYGYTEQIHLKKNEYLIVGTGFLNKTMPFIRYKTDDICIPENQYFRIIGKRNSNIGLYGINNEFLAGVGLHLNREVFHKILTYQFIQEERGKAEMFIIVEEDFSKEDMKNIKKEIDIQTKGVVDVDIKIVDNLVLTQRGKFQKVISYVDN